jgi:hypothetical protein
MRTVSIAAAAFAFGVGSFAMTRDAHALGPVDLELGLKAGGASNPLSGDSPNPNPLGFGLGARAGVGIFGFYGGLKFMYYFGSSDTLSGPGESGSYSRHTVMYGAELGYSISILDLIVIRPQLGIGEATISSGSSVSGLINGNLTSGSGGNLYLEPGVTVLVGFGLWFVGADANLIFLPGHDNSHAAVAFNGQVGIKL